MSVYFAKRADTGLVKIGKSDDPARRVGQIAASLKCAVDMINEMPGDIASERHAHLVFRDLRVCGEWFRFTEEMLSFRVDPWVQEYDRRRLAGRTMLPLDALATPAQIKPELVQ